MSFNAAPQRVIASRMSLAVAALMAALALPAAAQNAAESRPTVTDAQRQTADKVATAGVPLSPADR